jgi:hypothetical protein
MSSSNGPILELILQKLVGIEKDVSGVKWEIEKINKRLNSIDSYIKTQSDIQESIDAQKFITICNSNYPSMSPRIFPLKLFYNPDNTLLTDIDGCVVTGSGDTASAYIIESKHAITHEEIRNKIRQFCKIEQIVNNIHPIIDESIPKTKYNEMIKTLNDLPKRIYLIFSSDAMDDETRNYILNINSGKTKIDERSMVDSFKSSDLYKSLMNSSDIKDWVKINLRNITHMDKLINLINNKHSGLESFKSEIMAHKNSEDVCVSSLSGKIGIMHLGSITWPENNGFANIPAYNGHAKGGHRKTRRR